MLVTPLHSQIIRLTKCLHLRPIDALRRPSAQFTAGICRSPWTLGGIGLEWWYSEDIFNARDAVTTLLIRDVPEFWNCDPESVSEVVMHALQEVCIDQTIFNVDDVVFSRKQTLFDCHAATVPEFAAALLSVVELKLRTLIYRRCTVYAVPRFQVTSFRLEADETQVIAKNDREAWRALIDSGYEFDGWTPERPYLGAKEEGTYAPPPDFTCVLVAEQRGTQKGGKFNSILKFRKLSAVLISIASERAAYPFQKAMARPFEFCIQFPHRSSINGTIVRSNCEPLVPYFVSDINIGPMEVSAARGWFEAYARCNVAAQSRVEKGAHFLNRAMNSEDIESYINYFVTLDALFGQRGAVESSILAGVRSLGIDAKYVEKASWLFELRNEIVHGGSRYLTEWPKHGRYTQHFRTGPLADIRALAQLAVLHAPRSLV